MNEVVKVSISGISFTFDKDAYTVMQSYLDKLETGYAKNPDGKEIIADIEARIAELILGKQSGEEIVNKVLVEEIVLQMGFPEDMDTSSEPSIDKFPRRLYRNPEGAKLGGVCSGVGQFLDIDPVWIRLLIFAPLLLTPVAGVLGSGNLSSFFATLFGIFFMLYFILWIAVPMARSPRQKLEMRGEKITANSIHESFSQDAAAMSSSPKNQRTASVWAELMYSVGRIILFVIKAFLLLIAIVIGLTAVGLLIGLLCVIIGGVAVAGAVGVFSGMVGISPIAFIALAIFCALLLLIILGYLLVRLVFDLPAQHKTLTVLTTIWFIILVYLCIMGVRNINFFRDENFEDRLEDYFEQIDDFFDSDAVYRHNGVTIKVNSMKVNGLDLDSLRGNRLELDTIQVTGSDEKQAVPVEVEKGVVLMVVPPDTVNLD